MQDEALHKCCLLLFARTLPPPLGKSPSQNLPQPPPPQGGLQPMVSGGGGLVSKPEESPPTLGSMFAAKFPYIQGSVCVLWICNPATMELDSCCCNGESEIWPCCTC